MVFESVIANLLNAYLGHFIDDVNASQLQLGAWRGNVELKNLAIKEDAFASLDLPFKIIHGHIGKLTAIIPWSSLYSSPVQLSLHDVFVVAVPNVLEEYDEDVEAERAWQAKKKQLNLYETTKKNLQDLQGDQKRKNLNEVAQEDDGFVTKLAAQVIKNVQILITNIHIVYEDKFTDSLNPFQVGLTLNKIVFQTVDESTSTHQKNKYSEAQKNELVFKVTSIDYLSIYFNCEKKIQFLSEISNRPDIDAILSKRIQNTVDEINDRNMDYVLKPVTFRGNLVINSKPEKFEFALPVADVDMILGDFIVHLKKPQLHAITSFMDSLSRIRIAAAFRKFRPIVGVHKHSNEWWQFALSSILERDIKPRRNNWNWKRMKRHRQKCREYKQLYKEKLLCLNASEKIAIEEELEDFERSLDVFNIILCRNHAEIECQPELEKRKLDDANKGGGWFSLSGWGLGWSSSSAKAEKETEEIVSDLKREMTQEEKEKLYNAIGYDSTSIGVLDTPKDFVGFILNFKLDSIKAVVTGFDENFKIGEFCMRNINLAIQFRPAASAANVSATFDSTDISTSNEDPNLRGKSASIDSRKKALAFARSASKNTDEPKTDFGLHLESKSFNFECSYEPKPEGVSMNMTSAVEEIQLTLTNFTSYSYKLPIETKYCIMSPCTIRMISQTEANNQVMHVEFTKLDIHMAPQAYKIINNVMNAFRGNTEIKIVEKKPPKAFEVLQPKLLSRDSRFRSRDLIDAALEVTEDMNMALQAAAKTIVASAPFDTGDAQREVYLDMRNINFVVEAGIVNPQPLIKFHSSIFGQLQNSNFIKLECQFLLNYYNEKKAAWEPMIEPVSYDPYPSGEPVLWKFDMIIDMKEINGQSVMNIELESQEQLDITITRTAVNVLLSLLDTLSEENESRADAVKPSILAIKGSTSRSDVHVFRNLLPFCIKYNVVGKDEVHELEAGEDCELDGVRFNKTEIRIKLMNYLDCSWVADSTISGITEDEEFDTWKFFPSASIGSSAGKSLDPIPYNPGHRRTDSSDEYTLTVLMTTMKDPKGHVTSTLFSPYWLINKTHMPLSWKFSGKRGYNVVDPGNINYPVLMSFKQSLFTRKRMHIKVGDSELSEGFPVDVVGSKGTVLVKGRNGAFYTVAVHITMSSIGLTKLITAHPFYLIINKTKHIIEYSEDNDEFKPAMSKDTTPLWPHRLKDLTLCFRFLDKPDASSKPVSLTISNACLLNIFDRLVYVTIEVEESGVQITLEDYFEGCSPILFVNGTEDCVISYGQAGCRPRNQLPPMHSAHFTWYNPLGERTVLWSINDEPEQVFNPRHDMISFSEDKETCWVSFVDGSQRVLFVTHNFTLASEMMHAIELVQPQMNITMQSRGFGLSLVDDIAGLEIAYLGIAPSDLIWEIKQPERRHYQPLPLKDIEVLEAAYKKQYARLQSRVAAGIASASDSKLKTVTKLSRKMKVEWPNDVNSLDCPIMIEPMAGQLRRVKNRGIWGYIGYSEHTTQLHFKLSHMQIDNQMSDCLFSTLMSQILAPRSIVGDQVPKPFFEFSAIITRQANLRRFKYLSLLVQEFFIKIEYSFIQHLMEFSNEASTWYYRNYTHREMIESDLDLVLNSHNVLVDSLTRSSRIFYDLIHFSPLKLNVSFSLSSKNDDDKDEGVSLPLGLDFILRSAGVTLTEFQDVTFRLDCFERSMILFTQEQLMWASLDHYKRQILKQFYAIVFGLDVIGNPVSLVMDLKQGVGDFFYEPIQGIIKGPEEAVEGLALGVASLFSHTVGGAIGALSKISGTLGEGISSLTFDDELKKRRRQRRREQPNIARNVKDLGEGLLGGITGLVTQPVSGAKEDGFEGFMKGVGKGMIGVVTQPATSIVDFATGTLNAIKICVNEQKGPKRLRPPRLIIIGQPLSSYNRYEAEKLLNSAKKKERSLFS